VVGWWRWCGWSGRPRGRAADAAKIQAASTDVVNAFTQLDLSRVWGDGSRVAVDGSQIDTWADNLLAETSIRYGGYGGIAFRHIADKLYRPI